MPLAYAPATPTPFPPPPPPPPDFTGWPRSACGGYAFARPERLGGCRLDLKTPRGTIRRPWLVVHIGTHTIVGIAFTRQTAERQAQRHAERLRRRGAR